MQPGSEHSSAGQPAPAPHTSSSWDDASEVNGASSALPNSMSVAEAPRLRPADNAFRERHEPETAHERSEESMLEEVSSAGNAKPTAQPAHWSGSEDPELSLPQSRAAEQHVGHPASQSLSDDRTSDTDRASDYMQQAELTPSYHAEPSLIASGQKGRHHELVGEHGEAGVDLGGVAGSATRPGSAAERDDRADRLAHAEALERALATGAVLASRSENADRLQNSSSFPLGGVTRMETACRHHNVLTLLIATPACDPTECGVPQLQEVRLRTKPSPALIRSSE